jgi:hypothetical protein
MDSYIQSFGQYNTIIDGNVIDNAKWNMVYDGDVMDLETQQNNENMYLQLDNKEIMKLFQLPSSKSFSLTNSPILLLISAIL